MGAGDAPAYVSGQELGGGGGNTIAIPAMQNTVGLAAEKTFGAAEELAVKIKKANDTTTSLNGLSNYYTQVDALKTQYRDDPDPATAVQRFQGDAAKLQEGVLKDVGNLDPEIQSRMRLHMITKGITDQNEVWTAARTKQRDGADADIIAIGRQSQTDAVTAPSPVARQEAVNRYYESVDGAASAGLITKTAAETRKLAFDNSLDHADVMQAIKLDPRRAIEGLRSPDAFRTLTPVQRETYVEHAQNAIDKQGTEAALASGAAFPAAASMIAGRIVKPGDTDQIFDKVILGLESGGKNLPPNAKGAFGPAQLMPETARDMAKAIGRNDLAAMDDAELTGNLMANPALNQQLGLTYWRQLGTRYGGNVPLMMAAYNAGPGNADKWKAAAEAKFGQGFTGEQLSSVIPFAETRDYLAKGHAIGGARLDAFGVSPAGRYEMGIKLGHELTQEQSRQNHIVDQLASVAMADDPVIGMLKQGVDVDPQRLAQTRGALVDAAATGSVENIKRLRDFDFATAIQPKVAQAYKLPFGALDAAVNAETARINAPGANPSWQETQQLDILRKTRDHIAKARDDDPTGLLTRAGIADPVAIDPAAEPNDPDFRAALGARGAQAITAQRLYGGTALALSPAETDTMKERWKEAGANERFGLLKAMADTLPDNAYLDTVKKFSGNADSGLLTANLLRRSPDLAREVLTGEDLMKTKDIGEKTDLARAALAEKVGGQIFPDARQQGAVVDAAIKVDIARRAAAGSLYDRSDMSGVSKAFEDIAGQVVKLNGARTVAPPGMPASQFLSIVEHLDEHDIAAATGLYHADSVGGVPFDPDWLASHAQLKPLDVGSSRYLMVIPTPDGRGAPVMTGVEAPKPLVLDMKMLAERHAKKRAEGIESLVRGIGDYDPVSYQQ